jgi:hypothetical protein
VGSRFLLKSPRAHFCLAVGAISQPRSRGIVADVSDTPAPPWRAGGRNSRPAGGVSWPHGSCKGFPVSSMQWPQQLHGPDGSAFLHSQGSDSQSWDGSRPLGKSQNPGGHWRPRPPCSRRIEAVRGAAWLTAAIALARPSLGDGVQ